MKLGVVALFAGVPLLAAAVASSEPRPRLTRTVWDSVYSAAQAGRGETAYIKSCARCHRETLAGADESPALTGSAFLANWNGQSLATLQDRIRSSMPTDDPGTLSRQVVTDVIAYMLKVNGFPAGGVELSAEIDSLKGIVVQATKP